MKNFSLLVVAVASSIALVTEAHVSFRFPCPRRASYNECPQPKSDSDWNLVDYDSISPVGSFNGINDPIPKHPASFPGNRPVFTAGLNVNTTYEVDAPHNGGTCQWTLSYDNGKTQVVIQDWFRNCLRDAKHGRRYTVSVKIPANAPSGPALLTWLWNNNEGSREMYASSADVVIQGSNGGSISGVAPAFCNYGPGSCFIAEEVVAGGNWGEVYFKNRKNITITVPPK
ncbi:hypothetical protein DFQ27_007827 [Actinomortierella ambigua]|uniref:Chitin-binding type-4 domain-containing protein n=1 Tax=Actinomortierella ambigua TaxID=1343610 RepID=A0A9P6QKM3_9FUNG|nr:hypothetical protein DFQ27_007827 [Actinomortierella ambigua]